MGGCSMIPSKSKMGSRPSLLSFTTYISAGPIRHARYPDKVFRMSQYAQRRQATNEMVVHMLRWITVHGKRCLLMRTAKGMRVSDSMRPGMAGRKRDLQHKVRLPIRYITYAESSAYSKGQAYRVSHLRVRNVIEPPDPGMLRYCRVC